jgi:hypothetical protein
LVTVKVTTPSRHVPETETLEQSHSSVPPWQFAPRVGVAVGVGVLVSVLVGVRVGVFDGVNVAVGMPRH